MIKIDIKKRSQIECIQKILFYFEKYFERFLPKQLQQVKIKTKERIE